MDKKKLKLVIPVLILVEVFSMFLTYKSFTNKEITKQLDDVKLVEKENAKMFAIMLEEKSGKYKESTENTWPEKGYVYNKEKSGCVDINGEKIEGILSFDEEKKMATVDTGKTSYCYLYFDKDVSYLINLSSSNAYFKESAYKNKIKNAYFVDYINTEGALKTYDLSEAQDKSIIGWITNTYDLYIGSEKTIRSKDLSNVFLNMNGLETAEFSNLDTTEVENMGSMFRNTKISDISPLKDWDVSSVTNMSSIFSNKISDISPLKDWNVSNVTDMSGMFYNTQIVDLTPLKDWNVSNVTNMAQMFSYTQISDISPLKDWNVSNVEYMGCMFQETQISDLSPIKDWNTSNVIAMESMFQNTKISDTTPIKDWDVSNVTWMPGVFSECSNLMTVNLSGWNTSNVANMENMFYRCTNLTTVNLSGWNTPKVTNMVSMFYGCTSLTKVDMRNATFRPFTMFYGVPKNIEIIVKEDQVDLVRRILTDAIGEGNGTVRTP